MKTRIIISLFTAVLAVSSCNIKAEDTEKPNIVFFIADDMYPDMFNYLPEGKGKNLTPNMDKLASEGVILTNQYCVSPLCTPSRYNSLTGNYASRSTGKAFTEFTRKNEGQTVIQWNSFITSSDKTIGSYMKELGYTTGFVGKNHVVEDLNQVDQSKKPDLFADPTDPEVKKYLEDRYKSLQQSVKNVGFDYADGLYHNNPNWLGIKALAVHNTDWITQAGLEFINQSKQQPFFLYFATTIPHGPTKPELSWNSNPKVTAKGFLNEAPNVLPARNTIPERLEAANLSGNNRENLLWLDDAVGALIDQLEENGQLDNTIIFFFNDQGQKSKGTLYQGGIRTQSFIWRSNKFECENRIDAPISNIDFLPTILEMAGMENTEGLCDGSSFMSVLDGKESREDKALYFELGYARAVVKGKYKYMAVRYPQYATNYTIEQKKELLLQYNAFRESFGTNKVTDDYTLPYGHLEMVPGGGDAEKGAYGRTSAYSDANQLYNLELDPDEKDNLANDPKYSDLMKEMQEELKKFTKQLPGKFEI